MKSLNRSSRARARLIAALGLTLLIVSSNAGVSGAQDDLKTGARFEKQGQFFRAAEAYLRAVRLKPRDKKARRALESIAERAIEEKLQGAEALEAGLRADEAIAEMDAAAGLRMKLTDLGIETQQGHDIATRRDALVSRRIQTLFAEAESARAEGLWSAGIAHLQRVEALRPGLNDAGDRLQEMWIAWGDMNVREGRLRAAAERYENAARVPGKSSSSVAARAAALRVDLGKSALEKGACRSAVADLRKAEQMAAGSVKSELLSQATSCAVTCVRLAVSVDPGSRITDSQLDLLEAEVRTEVTAGASEFLQLRTSSPGEAKACDGRKVPGVEGEPMKVGPYSAVVRVTAVSIIRQPASSVTQQTRISHGPGTETLATYEEYREALIGTVSGWLTITDTRSPGLSLPLPLRASGQSVALWQRSPMSTVTQQNVFTGQGSTAVLIDTSGRGKAQAERERSRARADLADTLLRNLATDAAQRLLSTIDVEPAVADPIVAG